MSIIKKLTVLLIFICFISSFKVVSSDLNGITTIKTIPIYFEEPYLKDWNTLGQYIVNTNYKTYILNWTGGGGLVEETRKFIKFLNKAKAQGKTIIFNVIGPSYSGHAFAACYATTVYFNATNRSFLMFHADGYTEGNTYYRILRPFTLINDFTSQCESKGLLPSKFKDLMYEGYEIYKFKTGFGYKKDLRIPEDPAQYLS